MINTVYTYNENNQLIQLERIWDLSFGDNITTIQYDSNGNPIVEGTVYDSSGRITESIGYHYSAGEDLETKITWTYGNFYIYTG